MLRRGRGILSRRVTYLDFSTRKALVLRPSEKGGLGMKLTKGVEVFIALTLRGHPGSDSGFGVRRHDKRNWLTLLNFFFSEQNILS